MQPYRKNNFLPGMDASILVLCANRHFTGVTVTFYRCFGRFTGFRDGQGVIETRKSKTYNYMFYRGVATRFINVYVQVFARF